VVYDLTDGDTKDIPEISYERAIREASESDNEEDLRGATFIIDSGCTHHVVNDITLLSNVVFASKAKIMGTMKGCFMELISKSRHWEQYRCLAKFYMLSILNIILYLYPY